MKARRIASLAVSALVVASATAGLTYALWGQDASMAASVIRAGDLDLQLVGAPTWEETSPDVTPTHTFGARNDTTLEHLATPGDSFVLKQQFRTVLVGDNLEARFTVRWAVAPSLAPVGGVTATYVVTPPFGSPTSPVTVGTAVTLPGTTGTALTPALVGNGLWTVTVTLQYTGTNAIVVAPSQVTAPRATSLGTIVVELNQVRAGV